MCRPYTDGLKRCQICTLAVTHNAQYEHFYIHESLLKIQEVWVIGKNTPCGGSSRILNMIEMNNNVINEYPFITIK